MQKLFKALAVVTSFVMLFVLIGGSLVTKTGSGDGCGDSWPLCNGELIPSQITFELIIELSHRLVSGTAGILVIILAIWSWKRIGHIRETKFLASMSVIFLIAQALFGAAAVVWGQSDTVLAIHFGISLISFATVLLLTLLIFEVDKKFDAKSVVIAKGMRMQIYALIVYLYAVVYTGALVRHTNSSLACQDFPLCTNGSFSLPATMYEWVQMGHRLAALILFVWTFVLMIKVYKQYRDQKVLVYSITTTFILLCLQALSGIATVFTLMNYIVIPLMHALFVSCAFAVLSYLVLLANRSSKNEKEQNRAA
ncbi:COX15/CtaA family protein [Bacillus solimangrovi]|uniref:COX15/CtaA family protein n=1 Tax=Bacillus solimangrovi TaxID=1305675 RepID=UPI0009F21072